MGPHSCFLHAVPAPGTDRIGLLPLLALVCRAHGVEPEAVLSKARYAELVAARRDFARRARRDGHSFPSIGRALNRTHWTAMALVNDEGWRHAG